MPEGGGGRVRTRWSLPLVTFTMAILLCLSPTACGRESPEATVYHFLGAVQAQDFPAMRSFVNPEARRKVEGEEFTRREWEELRRRYLGTAPDWRFRFESLELVSRAVDPEHALVTLSGGRCTCFRLRNGRWVVEGGIDFSQEDFIPLYLAKKDGEWYLETLDLYVLYALENACRD
ncbi:MAG: hypothetical protein ACUVS1_03815 [Actinomycetota bacterium]